MRGTSHIQLSLIVGEVLKFGGLAPLQKQFKEMGCYAVHLLHNGRALAINYTNQPLDRTLQGKAFEAQQEVRGRVVKTLVPLYVEPTPSVRSLSPRSYELLTLGTPDLRFEICAEIPKGEVDRSWFPMSSYFMKDWQPMEMHVCFAAKSKSTDQQATFEQIRQWHQEATSTGFGDERIEPGELKIGSAFTSKNGLLVFPVMMPYREPVTYPWLELWLRLRSGLPKTRRCKGIEFVNPKRIG